MPAERERLDGEMSDELLAQPRLPDPWLPRYRDQPAISAARGDEAARQDLQLCLAPDELGALRLLPRRVSRAAQPHQAMGGDRCVPPVQPQLADELGLAVIPHRAMRLGAHQDLVALGLLGEAGGG